MTSSDPEEIRAEIEATRTRLSDDIDTLADQANPKRMAQRQVDKTRDRETGGTGLGLAISHQTVLLHGGVIRLASKEGEGSTFIVRLPVRR